MFFIKFSYQLLFLFWKKKDNIWEYVPQRAQSNKQLHEKKILRVNSQINVYIFFCAHSFSEEHIFFFFFYKNAFYDQIVLNGPMKLPVLSEILLEKGITDTDTNPHLNAKYPNLHILSARDFDSLVSEKSQSMQTM